jgi:UDP-glucose 4-epimerase
MHIQNLKNKKVLILGGTGFLGKAAIHAFKKAGAIVTAIGSKDEYNLEELAANNEIFLNLAAIVNSHELTPSKETLQVNVHLSRILLEAVRRKNPKAKVIFTSSQTVYGPTDAPLITEEHPINPQTIYAKQKYEAETIYQEYAKLHGMKVAILRFANIYGPGAETAKSVISLFAEKAKKGGEISVFGEGDELRDYLFIEDAAQALLRAASTNLPEIVYNCGSGEYHSLSEIAAYMIKHVGKGTIKYKPFPKDYARYPGHFILNSDKFRKDSGWKPEHTFEEGLLKMLQ